jgi:hypothetical protein
MGSVDEATAAIAGVDGFQYENTTIRVKFADNAPDSKKAFNRTRDADATPSDNLFVWWLPVGYSEDSLRQLFEQYAPVVSVKYVPEKKYGFVRFSNVADATTAKDASNGLQLGNETIKVKFADNPNQKQQWQANSPTWQSQAPQAQQWAPTGGPPAGGQQWQAPGMQQWQPQGQQWAPAAAPQWQQPNVGGNWLA